MLKLRPLRRSYVKQALAAIAIVLFLLAAPGRTFASTDVFGRSSDAASAPASAPQKVLPLPAPIRRLLVAGLQLQGELNRHLQVALAQQRTGETHMVAWSIVLFSFIYGVLHAVGPGHGKLAVGAYLMSHRARLTHAAFLSTWAALVQAGSAILLVGGFAWVFHSGMRELMTYAEKLDLFSYLAMSAVGLWTLWSILTRRDCCDYVAKIDLTHGTSSADQAETYLGQARGMRCQGRGAWRQSREGSGWIVRQMLLTGLAVGIRPCVGAIFVLLAALANGIFLTGVLATLAMAAGVALTVLLVGLASVGVNRAISRRLAAWRRPSEQIRRGLALSGALFITVFSILECLAILSGFTATTLT